MIDFKETSITKKGEVVKGDVTYNVNVMAKNGELTSLRASIVRKKIAKYPDGNGGFVEAPEDAHIGNMMLENGRKTFEIANEEDIVEHINVFQQIIDEVVGKPKK